MNNDSAQATQQICALLMTHEFTVEQRNSIVNALNDVARRTQQNAKRQFRIGDRVSNSKYGAGVVKSIGPKNIVVTLDDRGLQLRCSPTLLEKI